MGADSLTMGIAYRQERRQVRQLRKQRGGPPSCCEVRMRPITTDRKESDSTGSSRGARNSSMDDTKLRLNRSNLRPHSAHQVKQSSH